MTWVFLSLAAVGFQTTRNGLARTLTGRISPTLNSWSRFAFTLPLAALLVAFFVSREGMRQASPEFWLACAGTALAQLGANVALVSAFQRSNFAQSIVFHKLEVLVTAAAGAVLFSEVPSKLGWVGLVVSTAGVVAMSFSREVPGSGWRRGLPLDSGSLLALVAALGIALASLFAKAAVQALRDANPEIRSGLEPVAHALFHVSWMEVAVLSAALGLLWPGEFRRVPLHWRRMAWVGATGFGASLAWFWAFSEGLVAYVRAIGQLESVVAVWLAVAVFNESEARRQIPGAALVVGGIALVLIG